MDDRLPPPDGRDEPRHDIAELATLGGVSRRTVRYYVQRGLLPAPTGTGRGKHYTQAHVERLVFVRQQQEAGIPLDRIAAALGLGEPAPTAPAVPNAPAPDGAQRGRPPEPAGPPDSRAGAGVGTSSGSTRGAAGNAPVLSRWTRIVVDQGIELHLSGPLPDEARLRAAVAALRTALAES